MPTTYTSQIGLALPTTGELTGTWGTVVNDYITRYLDAAIAGTQTLSTDADVTLTTTNGSNLSATSAQYAILNCTGARTVQRTITVPATSKTYLVINGTTGGQSVKVVGAGPTTGVTLVNGERALIAWNGSDFVKVGGAGGSGTFNDVTITGGGSALNFSGTAQRITGDMSNATIANRLAFQSSTVNGNTDLQIIPNGTAVVSGIRLNNNSDTTNAGYIRLSLNTSEATVAVDRNSVSGTYLPLLFNTGGSERVRIDTSGNVAVGTTNAGTAGLSLSQTYNLSWDQSATESVANLFRQTSSAALVMSVGYKRSATANGFASSFGSSLAKTAISLGTTAGAITFYTDTAATTAVGTDVTPTERMRIDSSGNVGIGTASPAQLVEASLSQNGKTQIKVTNVNAGVNTSAGVLFGTSSGDNGYIGANGGAASSALGGANAVQVTNLTANPVVLATNGVARLTLSSTGAITSSDLADAVGYKGTPLNEQSTAYTLVIGDMGKSIVHPASDNNPRTFTIPANGTVAYPVGTTITFINMINTLTIAITTDTMYLAGAGTTGSRTLAAYGMATAVKMTSTTWIISGNNLT